MELVQVEPGLNRKCSAWAQTLSQGHCTAGWASVTSIPGDGGWPHPLSESYLVLILKLEGGGAMSQSSLGDSSGKGLHVLGSLWGRQS